jgi:hypothetical protein
MATGVTHISPVNYTTLDANGAGTITVLCGQYIWIVYHKTITITPVTSGKTPPVVNVYRNQQNPEMMLDYTVNGNGDASDSKHLLFPGDSVIAVWSTSGTWNANAQAAFRVEALQFPPTTPLEALAGLL